MLVKIDADSDILGFICNYEVFFFNLLVKIDADSDIWGFICNNEVFLEGC